VVATDVELGLFAMDLPLAFESNMKVAYTPESRQVVIEYELPDVGVVPTAKNFRFIKSRNQVAETARPASQIKSLYAGAIQQLTLLCLANVFAHDRHGAIDVVVFNGVVDTVDPRSGQPARPCLITVRVTRETFGGINLAHVDPQACLRHLSAGVSTSPTELSPVRPVLEFSMVDPRFVAATDAISAMDVRPNLLELTPTEFEGLIQNLFTSMGLEARQTRASRDGGVDCIAYDTRPIFGGKVVIQAKRYKNTVGVSAVRDLFGTLQNEGASKGILVTTSGYGAASFEFAKNKPIELIEGTNLLYLLETHAGLKARIEPPDDWRDPMPDSGEPPDTPADVASTDPVA
jgi:restriction system protein